MSFRLISWSLLWKTPSDCPILTKCPIVTLQVCTRWRDHLYRSPRYWAGLLPVIRCKELRSVAQQDRARLYTSLLRRGFHAVSLLGAGDEDALDLVHSFPLAAKHVHSVSLRCSSVSDRGLEALLDHLQVGTTRKRDILTLMSQCLRRQANTNHS